MTAADLRVQIVPHRDNLGQLAATFEKRIGKSGKITWRVKVRRLGASSQTRSFGKKSDGESWARSIETRIDSGESLPTAEARKRALGDAIDEYLKVYEKSARKKNEREQKRILEWWRAELGDRSLTSITPGVLAEVRNTMSTRANHYGKVITGSTVNRNLAVLSAVTPPSDARNAVASDHWACRH